MTFVSVGHFACRWCPVLQRESYKNPQIAARVWQDAAALHGGFGQVSKFPLAPQSHALLAYYAAQHAEMEWSRWLFPHRCARVPLGYCGC